MAKIFEVQLIDSKGEHGFKSLTVGEDVVTWGDSLHLQYSNIILHAVCTDVESFPEPCIYCQIEDGEEMEELRFVPRQPEQVQDLFKELSRCASLHPDEEEEEGGKDGGEGEFSEFFDASTSDEKLRMFEKAFVEPAGFPPAVPGQFDEVDEEDE